MFKLVSIQSLPLSYSAISILTFLLRPYIPFQTLIVCLVIGTFLNANDFISLPALSVFDICTRLVLHEIFVWNLIQNKGGIEPCYYFGGGERDSKTNTLNDFEKLTQTRKLLKMRSACNTWKLVEHQTGRALFNLSLPNTIHDLLLHGFQKVAIYSHRLRTYVRNVILSKAIAFNWKPSKQIGISEYRQPTSLLAKWEKQRKRRMLES